MNEDLSKQILTELQRLRRSNTIAIVVCIVMLAGYLVYTALRPRGLRLASPAQSETDSWASVKSAMDRFDFDTASGISQRLVQQYPNDYYGYTFLGDIALATGRAKDAESHYKRACELLPSDENQKMLRAIQQRIQNDAATDRSNESKPK